MGATVLYGCEAWTLKLDQQKRLRTTQRKMIRAVLGMKRRVLKREGDDGTETEGTETASDDIETPEDSLEAWSDFLKRATRAAEGRLAATNQEEWITLWRRRQWRWAGKLARPSIDKWLRHASNWYPPAHGRSGAYRVQARPLKRWSNDFQDFMVQYGLDGSWEQLAKNEEEWAKYESCFVTWASDKC